MNEEMTIPTFKEVWPILNKKLDIQNICGHYVILPSFTSIDEDIDVNTGRNVSTNNQQSTDVIFNNYQNSNCTFEDYLHKHYLCFKYVPLMREYFCSYGIPIVNYEDMLTREESHLIKKWISFAYVFDCFGDSSLLTLDNSIDSERVIKNNDAWDILSTKYSECFYRNNRNGTYCYKLLSVSLSQLRLQYRKNTNCINNKTSTIVEDESGSPVILFNTLEDLRLYMRGSYDAIQSLFDYNKYTLHCGSSRDKKRVVTIPGQDIKTDVSKLRLWAATSQRPLPKHNYVKMYESSYQLLLQQSHSNSNFSDTAWCATFSNISSSMTLCSKHQCSNENEQHQHKSNTTKQQNEEEGTQANITTAATTTVVDKSYYLDMLYYFVKSNPRLFIADSVL